MLVMKRINNRIMTGIYLIISMALFSSSVMANENSDVKISVDTGEQVMIVTLEDNPTARDFLSLLPLTLTLNDYGNAEKNSEGLPKALSEEGAPESDSGSTGDLVYYAPWQNIAFFRAQGGVFRGVIKIGTITSGESVINKKGPITATISVAK